MKKYICILAGAALLAACEQKTETTPAASPAATRPPAATQTSPSSATDASGAATAESPGGTTASPTASPPGS